MLSHLSHSAMPRYTCQVCKKALPCRYEGEKKKETIKVITTWTSEPIEVQNGGEQCYPCPLCETDETGEAKITHWDQVEGRMHKRLRQHFTRHHHKPLKDAYSSDEVAEFYVKARQLRCKLIHGPDNLTKMPETSEEEHQPTSSSNPSTPKKTSSSTTTDASPQGLSTPRKEGPSKNEPSSSNRSRWLSGEVKDTRISQDFVKYLGNEMRQSSVYSYTLSVRYYLAWVKKYQNASPSIEDVWNYQWVKEFTDDSKGKIAPSTIYNDLIALLAAQRYTEEEGHVAPTERTKLQFRTLVRQAAKGKAAHRHVVAKEKRTGSVSLHEATVRIFENQKLYDRYQNLVDHCNKGESLSGPNFRWATGYAILQLEASNFKRTGNLCKIEYATAVKKLKAAIKHNATCELEIDDATKTGGPEIFSIVKPQRVEVLYQYATILRPSVMGDSACKDLFVSTVGTRLHHVAEVIKLVGESVDLPNITIKDLRTRVETDAAAKGDKVDRGEIAKHLAHTEATRDRHYLLADKRRSRKAAKDLETLLDDARSSEESSSDSSSNSDEEDSRNSTPDSKANVSSDSTPASSPIVEQKNTASGHIIIESSPDTSPAGAANVSSDAPLEAPHLETDSANSEGKDSSQTSLDPAPSLESSNSEDERLIPQASPIVKVLRKRTIKSDNLPPKKRRKQT